MKPNELIEILNLAENLKNYTRHSYTSSGRKESVAEHSWRLSLMAYFVKDEFPEANIDKVIKMCLIHDLGEAFTGDIPSFDKSKADEDNEKNFLLSWVKSLPLMYSEEMLLLFDEMFRQETIESKLFKALDNLEAVVQHNEADIGTWSENEYELNLVYGEDKVQFSPYLKELRKILRKQSLNKIKCSDKNNSVKYET